MLIINADDWGKNKLTTDNSLLCYKNGGITSVSAMMFMTDSKRATEIALQSNLDVGLHLNFTESFSAVRSDKLNEYHQRIAVFLSRNKYCFLLYNPLLKRSFDYVYKKQYEEYERLYNRAPTHIDGHHHMHLCANMVINEIIPRNMKIRRNFSFARGENNLFNRFYRHIIDMRLLKRYSCTDFFFSITPIKFGRIQRIVGLAKSSNVEIMVHPENSAEYSYLMSDEYLNMINEVRKSTFSDL